MHLFPIQWRYLNSNLCGRRKRYDPSILICTQMNVSKLKFYVQLLFDLRWFIPLKKILRNGNSHKENDVSNFMGKTCCVCSSCPGGKKKFWIATGRFYLDLLHFWNYRRNLNFQPQPFWIRLNCFEKSTKTVNFPQKMMVFVFFHGF